MSRGLNTASFEKLLATRATVTRRTRKTQRAVHLVPVLLGLGTTTAFTSTEAAEGMNVLRCLLSEVLLRRTKTMKNKEGQPIVKLPPRHVHIQMVDMVPEEREFYESILRRSRAVFHKYEDIANDRVDAASSNFPDSTSQEHEAEVRIALQRMSYGDKKYALRNRYAALFTLLLRMRMACDHPWLVIQGGRKVNDSNVIMGDSTSASVAGREGLKIKNGVRVVPAVGSGEISEEENLSGLFGQAFLEGLMSKMLQKREDRRAKEARKSEKAVAPATGPKSSQKDNVGQPSAIASEQASENHSIALCNHQLRASPCRQDAFVASIKERLLKSGELEEDWECPICLESKVLRDRSITSCGHFLCTDCSYILWPKRKQGRSHPFQPNVSREKPSVRSAICCWQGRRCTLCED